MQFIQMVMDFFRHIDLEKAFILLFIVSLSAEWLASRLHKKQTHQWRDSLNNFAIGTISFTFDFLFTLLMLPVWWFAFNYFRIFDFHTNTVISLLILFILVDFSEYWFHRFSHEINLLWSAHVVHHQSEFFNLTVGLRTSLFVPLFNVFFYSLFPLLGFDPEAVLFIVFVQGVYQLCIHTTLIGKLGWLEYVIVTPSAHRVHHGKNEIYIDKNYGKFFICWDQLFGTYQRETEEVEFGITTPLEKTGVLYSIFEPFRQLIRLCRAIKQRKKRWFVLFKTPGEVNELVKGELIVPAPRKKFSGYFKQSLVILLLLSICSCAVTKRKYMPGFYIHRKGIVNGKAEKDTMHSRTQNIYQTPKPIDTASIKHNYLKKDKNNLLLPVRNKINPVHIMVNNYQRTIKKLKRKIPHKIFNKKMNNTAGDMNGLFWIYLLAGVFILAIPPFIHMTGLAPWWVVVIDCLIWLGIVVYLCALIAWPKVVCAIIGWNILFIILYLVIYSIFDR